MGSDLSVVNAARVSFAKQHDYFDEDKDAKLVRYLARHGHWTPFGHTSVTVCVKAPIFVARQLAKHQVGLVWNEVSRRYVDDAVTLFQPQEWRGRAENVKQGSSEDEVLTDYLYGGSINDAVFDVNVACLRLYRGLLDSGVCPEQARMVLPQSMNTEWYWTGSIAAFARVCNLRLDSHTQKETQQIAKQIDALLGPLFPVSWKELVGGRPA